VISTTLGSTSSEETVKRDLRVEEVSRVRRARQSTAIYEYSLYIRSGLLRPELWGGVAFG
jgi:hypothetical protein